MESVVYVAYVIWAMFDVFEHHRSEIMRFDDELVLPNVVLDYLQFRRKSGYLRLSILRR